MRKPCDLVDVDGVYRRRRSYRERAAEADPVFDAALRRSLLVGIPMLLVSMALMIIGFAGMTDDIGSTALLMVAATCLDRLAPKAPKWGEIFDRTAEFE